MIRIVQAAAQGFAYYAKEAAKAVTDSYYFSGSLIAEWFGEATAALGLRGPVRRREFAHLWHGFAPDGKTKLVQNAGKDRFPAIDITLSPNGGVKVVLGLERDPRARQALERAVMESAKDTLGVAERFCLFSRRGAQGHLTERAVGMAAALFFHPCTRRQDPGAHVHAVTFNSVMRPGDGSFGAILGVAANRRDKNRVRSRSALHACHKELSEVFHTSLRSRMGALGYRTEDASPRFGYFKVVGVPDHLIREFSTRAKEIEADLKARGKSGSKESHLSAILTRPAKKAASLETLREQWHARAKGWDPSLIRGKAAEHAAAWTPPEELLSRIASKAEAHVFNRRETKLKAAVASNAHDANLNRVRISPVVPQASAAPVRHPEVPRSESVEQKALRRLSKTWAGSRRHSLSRVNVLVAAKEIELRSHERMTPREKTSLAAIARRRGAIQSIASKDLDRLEPVLKAASLAWKRQGFRPLLVAPNREEAGALETGTGIHAISVRGLRKGMTTNRGLVRGIDAAFGKAFSLGLGFRSGGFITYALKSAGRWIRLRPDSVVIIARADRVPESERLWIARRAVRAGAKVIMLETERSAAQVGRIDRKHRKEFSNEF